MARVEWMRAFLLLGFISGAHLSPEVHIAMKGYRPPALFYLERHGHNVLYRSTEDGDLLLVNCSQPDRQQRDGYDITCGRYPYPYYMTIRNLTMSHSGLYRAENWRAGNITEKKIFHLIVCADTSGFVKVPPRIHSSKTDVSHVNRGDVVCKLNGTLGNGTSLQVYRRRRGSYVLVLDSSSSLEPLVEDLKGRLQLDLNRSQVTWHGDAGNYGYLYCTAWREAQCQSMHGWKSPTDIHIFAHEEENLTLPCFLNITQMDTDSPYWFTPNGDVKVDLNQARGQEVMYVLNGSQSGDYSLIIPSVSQNHSGRYTCLSRSQIFLFVCPESLPTNVMFSRGDSVSMPLSFNGTPSRVHWYRKKALQSEELIVDCYDGDDFLDLRGRVSLNRHNYSLNISDLREEDSAVYTWRVFDTDWTIRYDEVVACYEGSIRLVYKDPFGVDSPFYRVYGSVLGAVLLGLVAAVIWVNLRSRRGLQTSGHQRRKRKQSGDEDPNDVVEEAEDLYDDVGEAEDSV